MDEQHHTSSDHAPQFVTSDSTAFPGEYALWLKDIKLRYRQAQSKAAIKVNTELLQFYWQLGKDIVAMRIEDHWGKGVMKQLSLDLRAEFPDQAGFSLTNLKYIKRWHSFYSQEDIIGHQAGDQFGFPTLFGQIPWGQWSLQDINKPIGVSSYQLQEVVNRTIEELESKTKKQK